MFRFFRWKKPIARAAAAPVADTSIEPPHPGLLDAGTSAARRRGGPAVRVSWVWSTKSTADLNVGDALSAVMVSCLSGLPIIRGKFKEPTERLAAVGTIGHGQYLGKVHYWGTGFDARRNFRGEDTGYERPVDTEIVVHATRGPQSAALLRRHGIAAPDVYGDPVWFLPKIIPAVPKTHDLGIIVHISELDQRSAASVVQDALTRYKIPPSLASTIRIINTYTRNAYEHIEAKIAEVTCCRRILSTSLHGLVFAESYGMPCAWFGREHSGPVMMTLEGPDCRVDHRMVDLYLGVGRKELLTYGQNPAAETDFDAVMRALDERWEPLDYTGRALFDAFPLPKVVEFDAPRWTVNRETLKAIPF